MLATGLEAERFVESEDAENLIGADFQASTDLGDSRRRNIAEPFLDSVENMNKVFLFA